MVTLFNGNTPLGCGSAHKVPSNEINSPDTTWKDLTYTIDTTTESSVSALFQIAPTTGIISDQVVLDYEKDKNDNGLKLILRVTDGPGLFALLYYFWHQRLYFLIPVDRHYRWKLMRHV